MGLPTVVLVEKSSIKAMLPMCPEGLFYRASAYPGIEMRPPGLRRSQARIGSWESSITSSRRLRVCLTYFFFSFFLQKENILLSRLSASTSNLNIRACLGSPYGGTGHEFCRFHKRGLPPSTPV